MKRILIFGFGFLLINCGGDPESSETQEVNEEKAVEELDQSVETDVVESNYVSPPEEKKWQIDDYAEFLLNARIVSSADSMNYENGDMYYYERLSINGGYARITGAFEGVIEFGLWRMGNGNDLIGRTDMGCGPVCDYSFSFFEQDKNNGIEVTESIIPLNSMDEHQEKVYELVLEKYPEIEYPEDKQYRFFMPPHGTSMNVNLVVGADEVEVPLLQLGWDQSKFFIEALYETIP